jgi:hypothetical protein
LEDLAPEFIPAVPEDPSGQGAFRLVTRPDGIVIYTPGLDGIDSGGEVDPQRGRVERDLDLGFRPWNVEARRQPPPAEFDP